MIPNPQQSAIITAFGQGQSLAVCARAGAGKTSTIKLAWAAHPREGLALAFNKKNAEELSAKISVFGATCATLNSLGHRAWAAHVGRVNLDTKKFYGLFDQLCPKATAAETQRFKLIFDYARSIGFAPNVQLAKPFATFEDILSSDLDVEASDEEILDKLLRLSIKAAWAGAIDFIDQIYMPAIFGSTLKRFNLVVVDEAQDLSATQHALVRRSLQPNGQIIIIGDPAQAIYAWRGADNNSFYSLTTMFNLETFPLSVSFRCPKAVIAQAQRYVPDISAADTVPEGSYAVIDHLKLAPGDAYISRTNAPLIKQAYALLAKGIVPNYLGRDFTVGIRSLLSKAPTHALIDKFIDKEISSAKTKARIESLEDRRACAHMVLSSGDPKTFLAQLKENPDSRAVTLSTVHKAKGLEWNNVTINLDSKFSSSQDSNIAYVAITRAKNNLRKLQNASW
jgi:superfamily I DNA/RNA helicase